jgi:hypothetical protein
MLAVEGTPVDDMPAADGRLADDMEDMEMP